MNRRISIWVTCLFFSAIVSVTKAQDQANFTQFYLNPYLINPSFAGIDGQSSFSVIYRRQWMNIDGGPSIANVSLHTPVNAKTNVGLSVSNDKRGLLSNTSLLVSLGYNLSLADNTYLRFGVSAGGAWNTVDMEKLDAADPALASQLDQHASVTGNAGLSFHYRLFHMGVAMPTIFSPAYVSPDAFTITEVNPFQSLIVHASNRFYFNNNNNVFEPYALYRMNTDLPSQFEVAGIVHLNHILWAGGSYKQDFGISALAGIKLQHKLAIGASYSLQNSGINELNSPTFEVSLNLLFGKHKKGTHVYSFVNTVKEKKRVKRPSASEAIAAKRKAEEEERKKQLQAQAKAREEERRKQEDLAKAEADRKKAEADRKRDEAAKEPIKQEPVITQTPTPQPDTPVVVRQHNPRLNQTMYETFKTPEELAHEQEKTTLKRLEEHAENPTEHHDAEPDAHPNAERHEFVKKGGHEEELDVSDYIIGGVFKSDANAKHFAEGLQKLGFKADYGHLTEKNLWYVYLLQTTDINHARAERDRYRKMKLLKDAWLLTVHH